VITRANGFLSKESRINLSQLLGQNIWVIYSTSLNVRANSGYFDFSDMAFAIHPQKKFLIIHPAWEEDSDGEDYGWFETTIKDAYENITFDKNRCSGPGPAITLTPASPVSRITLFQKGLFPDIPLAENWPHHFGLLFEHKERFRYLLTYYPSAFQSFHFTFDEDKIAHARERAESEDIIQIS
jgi:hypothetical protein